MGPAGPREAASKLPGDSNKFRQTEETFPGRLWHESLAPLPSSGRSRGSNIPTLELLARGEPVGAGLHARNVTNGCQESALSREAEPDRERGRGGRSWFGIWQDSKRRPLQDDRNGSRRGDGKHCRPVSPCPDGPADVTREAQSSGRPVPTRRTAKAGN
ncbi:uncharacterized protein LOC143820064 isoform X2 [Paroedura picta]|uniref:uncharacterized protein LOC143820064 isoform X2 n=1 Tax=Paroedura picta TaxID=143630 RepID=UPI004056B406